MAKFCLPHDLSNKFLRALKSGDIDVEKLITATDSQSRRSVFAEIVGKNNAKEVNALFEQVLVSRQKNALTRWVKKVTGIDATTRKELAEKIDKIKEILNPENNVFFEDLASSKLRISMTADEAKKISELAQRVLDEKKKIGDKKVFSKSLGEARLDLMEYRDSLLPEEKLGIIDKIGSTLRALRGTADLAAPLRQGRGYFHTKEWWGAAKRMFGYAKSDKKYKELMVNILGDPDYELAQKAKLALTALGETSMKKEEQFMKSWVSNLPVVTHSDRGYTGFLTDLRFNRFKRIINGLRAHGEELTDKQLKDIAETINTVTGRGSLGEAEQAAKTLTRWFWSPKLFKSRLDMLAPILNPKKFWVELSPAARKEALTAYMTTIGTSITLMGLLDMMIGTKSEFDLRSSDFGKVKIGNRTIDTLGGFGIPLRVATQVLLGKYKTQKGQIRELDSGEFGERKRIYVLADFLRAKQSPLVGAVSDIVSGRDFMGRKTRDSWERLANTVLKNVVPLAYVDVKGQVEDYGIKGLGFLLAEFFGASVQEKNESGKDILMSNLGIDERSSWQKVIGLAPRNSSLDRLIDKMVEKGIRINEPTQSTMIKGRNNDKSRLMTKSELLDYRLIYKRKLASKIRAQKDILMRADDLEKRIEKIKRETTLEAKEELIRRRRL